MNLTYESLEKYRHFNAALSATVSNFFSGMAILLASSLFKLCSSGLPVPVFTVHEL